ncbi:malonate decarboxylase subunit epsilon [Chromobacterium sp. Beijing]|uniref:malonate decarboxylase subunit epsilon n=1 Tax=Chromobacterium sp. Beijing TaxID=2735795 RepID=UPI001F02C95E|nr:malonate decarboxylase subunit epsilon [Chromobacterium sp. Beijing]UJB32166.1 malonate decarboxylase subunit epsilon [Chromobacterium sp. Beijing]
MSVLFAFPGQGAQRAGMLHCLPEHSSVAQTLKQAGEVLAVNPLTLDSVEALQSTRAVQLCLLIAGVAATRLLAASGWRPAMVAGLSIGAWPAAVAAQVVGFDDALRLVALRGELMQTAFPMGYGMLAVTGLNQMRLEGLIAAIHCAATPLYLANLNGDVQFVAAGHGNGLAKLETAAKAAGARACQSLELGVPSHCPLLEPAAQELRAAIARVAICRPAVPYLSVSRARLLFDAEALADDLACNMARQQRWTDAARHAWERGMRTLLELPPGRVLGELSRETFRDGKVMACEAMDLSALSPAYR